MISCICLPSYCCHNQACTTALLQPCSTPNKHHDKAATSQQSTVFYVVSVRQYG